MAGIYKREGSKFWWARFVHKGAKYRRSTETASRSLAQKRADQWERSIKESTWGEQPPRKFNDAMHAFLIEHGGTLRPQSRRRYLVSANHMLDPFDGLLLSEITKKTLRGFETLRRKQGASPPTIRRDLACLSSMFSFEMEHERIDHNPVPAYLKARKRRGLKESPPRTRYLSHEEEAALLAAAPSYLAEMIKFAIDTGLRFEEQFSLTWPQVSRIRQEATLHDTKSGVPRRVPLLQRAGTVLDTATRHLRPGGEPDWIFCKRDGTRYTTVKKSFASACARAGVKDLRWHDLRRTCGCRLLQDHKMSIHEVRDWLGHASVAVTERSYAFLKVDQLHHTVGTFLDTGEADSEASRAE